MVDLLGADSKEWELLLEQVKKLHESPVTSAKNPYRRPNRIPQRQTRLTEAEIDRLVERYESGQTTYQLAEEFMCWRGTISKHLKARGVKIRGSF